MKQSINLQRISTVSYDHKQIAKELEATAMGVSYYGNALYVSRDLPWTTDNDRLMLTRWLHGSQTSDDFHALQDFAILTGNKGKINVISQYYKDRTKGHHAAKASS